MTASTEPSYSTDTNTGIAFDFSPFFDRMATALETIATNSTTISTTLTNIKTDLDTLATNSTTVKNLATGHGIHMVGPYDWLGLINVYRSLIEQGNITDTNGNVSEAQQAAALALVESYITKIQNFPTNFE
jgi:hypothetical protein